METIFTFLAIILPIASIIFVPMWMKKNGKGRNMFVRIIAGFACAIIALIILALISPAPVVDDEHAASDEIIENNTYPINPTFEQFAYWKRDKKGEFNYRIFVYITDASPQDMELHAKKQMWSNHGTTMVCYYRSSEGLNSNAITLAKDSDKAIDELWKPSLIARYMHWPNGKEEFTENPYVED